MLYSKLFTKTRKTIKDDGSINAKLLQQAGFIDQVMAGAYTFLPLGLRVLNKIETIIREEMNAIGVEVLMPSVVPTELWERTGRLDTVDVLGQVTPANANAKAKNDSRYVISPTHEEVVTPLAQKFAVSYKDLPCAYYQIQTKFRNEPRAKSGLLRTREFRMKDLYSFHATIEDFKKYYEKSKEVYLNVYKRLGIGDDTFITKASGGDFTEDYSHEFQLKVESGEDVVFQDPKTGDCYNKEVAPSQAPSMFDPQEPMKPRQDVEGVGLIGVDPLAKHLNIPVGKTTKTMIFETDDGRIVAAAVRGGYVIHEEKLRRILKCKSLVLASANTIKEVTNAEVGYAGILGLSSEIQVVMDESLKGRRNFETGANRTNYHTINANFGRDIPEPKEFFDIKVAQAGDINPSTGQIYELFNACEVGNIFPLYTKFSEAFNFKIKDSNGVDSPVYMGCYGIGPTRIMGALVEKFHDDNGIIWPSVVAPYKVHLIGLDLHEESIRSRALEVYHKLQEQFPDEVLFDDREGIRAGEKFADADLMGSPMRIVISKRTGDKVEIKMRKETESKLLDLSEIATLF